MTYAIEEGTTQCPRCAAPLAFRLDAVAGGGLRYDVSCTPCGEVFFAVNAPVVQFSAAA